MGTVIVGEKNYLEIFKDCSVIYFYKLILEFSNKKKKFDLLRSDITQFNSFRNSDVSCQIIKR